METLKLFKDMQSINRFYGITESGSDKNNTRILSGYYIDPIKAISILFPGSLAIGILLEHEEEIYKWDLKNESCEKGMANDQNSE